MCPWSWCHGGDETWLSLCFKLYYVLLPGGSDGIAFIQTSSTSYQNILQWLRHPQNYSTFWTSCHFYSFLVFLSGASWQILAPWTNKVRLCCGAWCWKHRDTSPCALAAIPLGPRRGGAAIPGAGLQLRVPQAWDASLSADCEPALDSTNRCRLRDLVPVGTCRTKSSSQRGPCLPN